MAKVLFSNNAATFSAGYISSTDTSLTVDTGTGVLFPSIAEGSGDYFYITIVDLNGNFEIVKVIDRAEDTFTIVRAQDNTEAISFPQGSSVEQRVTAASLNDLVTTITDEIRNVPNMIYPVGSIYMSLNFTDPSLLFGGSWQKLDDGRVLLGANDTYEAGTIGGSYTHTLTVDELPVHSISGTTDTESEHTHTRGTMEIAGSFNRRDNAGVFGGVVDAYGAFHGTGAVNWRARCDLGYFGNATVNFNASRNWTGHTSGGSAHSHTFESESIGSGQSHSIVQPYLAVHMWKRVA